MRRMDRWMYCRDSSTIIRVMAATREKSWVVEIRNKIKDADIEAKINIWRRRSIYQVPACVKDLNPKAYRPQVVSFGPYHHGEYELMAMEEHKYRALLHFLRRADKPFDEFVASMEEVVEELMDAYQSLDDRWRWREERDEFLQMMIMDGCFMLEILRISTGRRPSDYASNDPIFSPHGMIYTVPYIKRDMLMIENQVPLLVLEKLVSVESGKEPNDDQINRLVVKFCDPSARPLPPGVGLGLHVVDLYRKSLLQVPAHHEKSGFRHHRARHTVEVFAGIRSAKELYEAGIRFKKSPTTSLRDIRFSNGVLSLPVIVVDDATEYLLLNLMAFERLHVGAGNEVTSYVFFMDCLIGSAKDARLLQEEGIIQNAVGSDTALAKLFNSMSKDVTVDPESSLDEVYMMVQEYCWASWNKWRNKWRRRWREWMANLMQTYFRSPWTFLSLVAATLLILMTAAQTVYTVYPYYKPSPYGNKETPPSSGQGRP